MSSAAKKIRLLQQLTTASATTASSPSTATPTLQSTNTSQSSAHHQHSSKHYHPPSSLASMPGNSFHHFNARCAGCVGKSRPGFTTSGVNSQNGSGGLPKQESLRTSSKNINIGGGGSLAMLKSALNTLTNTNSNYGNPNSPSQQNRSNKKQSLRDQPSYISSKCPNDPPAICIPSSIPETPQQQQRSFLPIFTSSPSSYQQQPQQKSRKSLTPRMAKPAPPLPIRSEHLLKLPVDNRHTRYTRLLSYIRRQQSFLPYETPIPATHPLAYNNIDLDAMENDYWLQRYDGGLGNNVKGGEDIDLWEHDSFDERSCWSGGSAGTNGVDEFVWDEDLEDEIEPPQPPPIQVRLLEEQQRRASIEQKQRRDKMEMDRPSFLGAGGLPLLTLAPEESKSVMPPPKPTQTPPAIPPRSSRIPQQSTSSYYRNLQNIRKEKDVDGIFTMEVRDQHLVNATNTSESSLRHKKTAGQWSAGCTTGIPQPGYTSYPSLKNYSGHNNVMASSPYAGYSVPMGRENLIGCY